MLSPSRTQSAEEALAFVKVLRRAAEFADLTEEELIACQWVAVEAAFCSEEDKARLREASEHKSWNRTKLYPHRMECAEAAQFP